MSNPPNSSTPAATVRSPRTWNFVETTFIALVAYAAFALTGGPGAYVIFLMLQDGAQKLSPTQFQELLVQGRWYGVALIVASPPTLAVLWVAIRMARREFAEYLALNWPSPKELGLAFAAAAGLIVAQMVLSPYRPPANSPVVVGGAAGLFVLLVGGCLAGPIMEEFVFRGFMFRGWSRILPWPGRSHRAHLGVVWSLSHPIRLSWTLLGFSIRNDSLHVSSAQQLDLADHGGPFSRQHRSALLIGTLRLGVDPCYPRRV